MARKKYKAGKFAVSAKAEIQTSFSLAKAQNEWLLPALGALALVFSWLALLGGISDGTLDLRLFFNADTIHPVLYFNDLVAGDPGARWRTGAAPYYFPDFALQWAVFALGADTVGGGLLFPLMQVGLSAVGWILVCDFLFGKTPARRAVVLLLHSLVLLISAWRGADLFYLWLIPAHHGGAWLVVPWLLWLSLLALRPAMESRPDLKKRKRPGSNLSPIPAAALILLLLLSVASDLLTVPWFVAPAAAAAVTLAWRGGISRRDCVLFIAVLAAGAAGGRAFYYALPHITAIQPPDFKPGQWSAALGSVVRVMGRAAKNNPAETAVWAAFCALALWRMAAVFHSGARRRLSFALPSSPGLALDFTALFIPAAVAVSLLAVIATGRGVDESWAVYSDNGVYDLPGRHLRYVLPTLFAPLFIGWALFAWRAVPRAKTLAAGASALIVCAAAPKMARMDWEALDPYATPFQQCFAENARRLDWTAGVSANTLAPMLLMANPNAGINRGLAVGVFRREGAGQSFMVADFLTGSTNWVSGEFQFVAVNWADGRAFHTYSSPAAGDQGCPEKECVYERPHVVMDFAAARAGFGEPQEVVNCEGIYLLHYDPPLKFDFSHLEDPYLALVARW